MGDTMTPEYSTTEDVFVTHEEARAFADRVSDHIGEWQGVPVDLGDDMPVRVHDRHPLREFYRERYGPRVQVIVGGPADSVDVEDIGKVVADRMENERIRNHWFCRKLNADVYVVERRDTGKIFAVKAFRSPDSSMDRLAYWMRTIGASDAWALDAEYKAREKLRGMLTERQWRHYDLTGSFLEASPRSDLTYVFRRLRPTIALTERWPYWRVGMDSMKCLAVLCLHPIGYYDQSWGGCMVPTDDVIAHLLLMRCDEVGFWKQANQHEPWTPEAGL